MPSQEDYLDNLLKDLIEDTEQPQVEEGDSERPNGLETGENVETEVEAEEPLIDNADIMPESFNEEMFTLKDTGDETGFDTGDETGFDMGDMDELLKFAMDEDDAETETTGMSEEEIEQILNSNANSIVESKGDSDGELSETDDLMSLLEGNLEDGSDLQDIHDMLQKADNNEAVDEERIAMMQEIPDVVGENNDTKEPVGTVDDAEESAETELTERQKKALEKKRLKEEKAAARKAAKEAKKAEKLAKRAAKKGGAPEREGSESIDGADMFEALPTADVIADTEPIETDLFSVDPFMGLEMSSAEDEYIEDTNIAGGDAEENTTDYLEGAEDGSDDDGNNQKEKPKRNLLSMILDFLTEEDEDEEEERGTEDIPLSDENRQVLEEMDQEITEKKGKKDKKKDKKAKKKDKKSDVEAAEGEDEESEGGQQDKKAKKPKKPKKEKPPREETPVDSRNKITFKKLLPIILLGMSMLLIIMLFVNLGSDFIGKNQARKAYYEKDYETCYQELYGRKLNETEQVMFGKSESILRIRLWMREYELFVDEESEMEALDVLIQSVNDYADLYDYANQWNAGGEVSEIYGQMLVILRDKYGLSEVQALEIAAEPDDVEYTRLVAAVVQGDGYTSRGDTVVTRPVELPDMLPEEKNFPENSGGR